MERIFCKDKKDFCDGVEDCTKCQYAKGNGVIAGYAAHDLLCTLFGNDYDLDHLRELVEADKAGRCVVLPCKPGDDVWYLTGVPSMLRNPFFDRVECTKAVGLYYDGRGVQVRLKVFHGNHGTYGYWGKTVFRTREEAEAALKKMNEAQT